MNRSPYANQGMQQGMMRPMRNGCMPQEHPSMNRGCGCNAPSTPSCGSTSNMPSGSRCDRNSMPSGSRCDRG
ncbi:MAG: hypothetical protein Q4F41_20200, partial [Eubacteriales bacterium]|nr:hypothetical protein [Eubacteriales bacterium]